jgi:hypothetical protein
MIVFSNGRIIGTKDNGDSIQIRGLGEYQNSLSTTDETIARYLVSILKELRIQNIHLQSITDQKINDGDIIQEIE